MPLCRHIHAVDTPISLPFCAGRQARTELPKGPPGPTPFDTYSLPLLPFGSPVVPPTSPFRVPGPFGPQVMEVSYASVFTVSTGSLLRLTLGCQASRQINRVGLLQPTLSWTRCLAATLVQSPGLYPGFRGEKRVKSSPYAQRTCFRDSQGISPLAPSSNELASGLDAFRLRYPRPFKLAPRYRGSLSSAPEPLHPNRNWCMARCQLRLCVCRRSHVMQFPASRAQRSHAWISITYPYAPLSRSMD
jgi:hypothetical protein